MHSGRMPLGSRNAYSASAVQTTMAYAPSMRPMAAAMPSRRWCVWRVTRPIVFAATSESVAEYSCTPSARSCARMAFVFMSVPLCASANSTSSMADICGWAASHEAFDPLVE